MSRHCGRRRRRRCCGFESTGMGARPLCPPISPLAVARVRYLVGLVGLAARRFTAEWVTDVFGEATAAQGRDPQGVFFVDFSGRGRRRC